MRFKVQEAIEAYNERNNLVMRKNQFTGEPGRMTLEKLGFMFYPETTNVLTIRSSMNNLNSGKYKKIRLDWIRIMHDVLGCEITDMFDFD